MRRRSRTHAVVILSLGAVLGAAAALSASAIGCVFRSATDCEQNLGYGCGNGGNGTGGGGTGAGGTGAGGTSTSSSGGGGGTGGAAPECKDASTCPPVPAGPCASLGKAACTQGKCGFSYTAGPAPSQLEGSCKMKMCDAGGLAMDAEDDGNVYDDGNPCTQETCTNGVPGQMDMTGQPCTLGGGSGYCVKDPYNSALVTCAECLPPGTSTCTGGAVCVKGVCVPPHCTNGLKDLGEIDLNCGGTGSGCLACDNFLACLVPADCASGVCMANKCAAPTCTDTTLNQDETDTDCGGTHCPRCVAGRKCILPSDCDTGVCTPSGTPGVPNTCQAPSCMDGVQNGDEEGIDCGGTLSNCPPCGS